MIIKYKDRKDGRSDAVCQFRRESVVRVGSITCSKCEHHISHKQTKDGFEVDCSAIKKGAL